MNKPAHLEVFNEFHDYRSKSGLKPIGVPKLPTPATLASSNSSSIFKPSAPPTPTSTSSMNIQSSNEVMEANDLFTKPRRLRQSKSANNIKTRKRVILNKDLPPLPKLRESSIDLHEHCTTNSGMLSYGNSDDLTLVSEVIFRRFCVTLQRELLGFAFDFFAIVVTYWGMRAITNFITFCSIMQIFFILTVVMKIQLQTLLTLKGHGCLHSLIDWSARCCLPLGITKMTLARSIWYPWST